MEFMDTSRRPKTEDFDCWLNCPGLDVIMFPTQSVAESERRKQRRVALQLSREPQS